MIASKFRIVCHCDCERGSERVPLEPKDWVAGYAAVVATASLGWQVWNNYRAKRPHLALLLDRWRTDREGSKLTLERAQIRIRNREDYAVRIDRLYFRYSVPVWPIFIPRQPILADIEAGDVESLPFEVPAREAVSLTIRPRETFAWNLSSGSYGTQPVAIVGMELRTGERYVSRGPRV